MRLPRLGALTIKRAYRVLAIESSCDDSAVCLIDRRPNGPPILEDHLKVTLDSAKDGGIIPVDALAHHLHQLGPVVNEVLQRNGRPTVDLVCATQGPGMFSSLAAGLQVGKGLAIAWNVPFIPVHHMLAHLLTPRFFTGGSSPTFPFLSLLVSGGHTMLVHSKALFSHQVLVNTIDNAVGNSLDKCARALGLSGTMLGKELDQFVGSWDTVDLSVLPAEFDIPLAFEKDKKRVPAFSFAHFASLMPRIERQFGWQPLADQPEELRRAFGAKLLDAMFTHIIRKTKLAVDLHPEIERPIPLLCAGGVAANSRLRERLVSELQPSGINVEFADIKWCTDNALMIGWAGIEIFESLGANSNSLNVIPTAKWPLSELNPSQIGL